MKRQLHLAIGLFLFAFTALKSQPAPNFTITDSDGQSHNLYTDYLDQGKTVVIKFFFTTCPPCNAMAPLMEPFYQEWGGGAHDVEFISLSIMNFDDNNDVALYKTAKGHTFPGAGSDGGSVSASQPYLNGMFGSFTGTPTFAVIAPDRSVIFDPRGISFVATLDSVDVAIRSTGAEKPPIPYTISGTVKNTQNAGVSGVAVSVSGLEQYVDTTNSAGQFEFTAMLEPRLDYYLSASKNYNFVNGVTTFDMIEIRKHVLALQIITQPTRLLAADANKSGGISTQDIVELRKLVLSVQDSLSQQESWFFYNAAYTFVNPEHPFPEIYNTLNAAIKFRTSSLPPFHFRALKIGDVNESADPGQ
jgi:thiol-disulfide isomerase/thioredoxin